MIHKHCFDEKPGSKLSVYDRIQRDRSKTKSQRDEINIESRIVHEVIENQLEEEFKGLTSKQEQKQKSQKLKKKLS